MLSKWYGMASYCADSNGFCRFTGDICRPGSCTMARHVVLPDDENQDEQERNDDNEIS